MRKEQSHDEYTLQLLEFRVHGPKIDSVTSLYDAANLVPHISALCKTDRQTIVHVCELTYYMREYDQCLQFIDLFEQIWALNSDAGVLRDLNTLKHIKERAIDRMRTKKSIEQRN